MKSGQKRPEKARKAEAAFLLRKEDCSVNSHTRDGKAGLPFLAWGPACLPAGSFSSASSFPLPHNLPSLTLIFHFLPLPPASSSTHYLSLNRSSFFSLPSPSVFSHTSPSISALSPKSLPALLLASGLQAPCPLTQEAAWRPCVFLGNPIRGHSRSNNLQGQLPSA